MASTYDYLFKTLISSDDKIRPTAPDLDGAKIPARQILTGGLST